jgi:hypothetical protein
LRRIAIILAVLSLSLATSCDDRADSKKSKSVAPPPTKVEHPGIVTGRVVFTGKAPTLARLTVSGDEHCMKLHPDGLPDESVVIGADGAMMNVFVCLKDAPRSDGSKREPAMIDQVACQYVPHAVAVQINQALRVKSSDPVLHNVHLLCIENPPMNLSETQPMEQTVRFASAEMISARCDVHPWMKAVIGVFDSPWFAVTGADGTFVIRDVPSATYTLAAWHERFGELTKKITVAPDGSVKEDFSYAP